MTMSRLVGCERVLLLGGEKVLMLVVVVICGGVSGGADVVGVSETMCVDVKRGQ